MAKRTLQDFLSLKQELEGQLKEHGIELDKIRGLMDQLQQYAGDEAQLAQMRNEQFHQAAYDLAVDISAASNKNVDRISAFLRKFARYVVSSVLRMETANVSLEDLLDRIPDMEEVEEEEA